MRRRVLLTSLSVAVFGCAPTTEQQTAALTAPQAATVERARETRRFDTKDRTLVMRASVGVLQDLGFTIEETQESFGVIVASKLAGGRVRVQIVVRAIPESNGMSVRANFQRVGYTVGANLARGETLAEPEIYRGFFDKLAQSIFLTAHEI